MIILSGRLRDLEEKMHNFNDLTGFGAFMVSLWNLFPVIVQNLILAVAALFVVIGIIQLID